jgi:hypothetical protein
VGNYTIVPVVNDPDGKLINYSVTVNSGTLAIVSAVPVVKLESSANPGPAGSPITFTVRMTTADTCSGAPLGWVRFKMSGEDLGLPAAVVDGVASCTVDNLAPGTYEITAEYFGDNNFGSANATLTPAQAITLDPPSLTLVANGEGSLSIVVSGAPGADYEIDFTENLAEPNWQFLTSGTADDSGYVAFYDTPPAGTVARFYRAFSAFAVTSDHIWKLGVSADAAAPGSLVTLTAKSRPLGVSTNVSAGKVQFKVDGQKCGLPVSLEEGAASFSTDALPVGRHCITIDFADQTDSWQPIEQLSRVVLIDSSPVACEYLLLRNPDSGTKVALSELISQASDADGDQLQLKWFNSTTAAGGTVALRDGVLWYEPPAGLTSGDSFTYLVNDRWGLYATGTVRVAIMMNNQPSPDQLRLDVGNGVYRILFSAIPWRNYTIEYTQGSNSADWHFLGSGTADSFGRLSIDDLSEAGAASREYRLNCALANVIASPFRIAVWTNFITQTNSRISGMWSKRWYPPDWPQSPPVFAWNTNCLIYGVDGFTGISQCNEFEGAPGQIPVTLLTRRHAYTRGHGMGDNGLWTNTVSGKKVWFCSASNRVVEMTIAADFVRAGTFEGNNYDYGLVAFTEDVPADITPMWAMSITDFEIYYYNTEDIPFLWLGTEQTGHCGTESYGCKFSYPLFKGGDSGSPNFIPSPDNKLLFFGGRTTTGPCAQMQADIDVLSSYLGLHTNDYQLRSYEFKRW